MAVVSRKRPSLFQARAKFWPAAKRTCVDYIIEATLHDGRCKPETAKFISGACEILACGQTHMRRLYH